MKNFILSTVNKAIVLLLVFLGFSCDSDDEYNGYVEYGSPSADFKATGTIVDQATLNRLSNIQVAMDGDTIYTDQNGEYEIIAHHSSAVQQYELCFFDTNSVYLPKDAVIDFSDVNFQNADGWYQGIKTLQVDIKLKPNELPD
jgi:putative lipoprotein (rSAM/lipoprotein system)